MYTGELTSVGYVAMIASGDKGYLQTQFSFTCNCGKKITKDILAIAKFVKDLVSTGSPPGANIDYDKINNGFIA